jgi:hypothetical protein
MRINRFSLYLPLFNNRSVTVRGTVQAVSGRGANGPKERCNQRQDRAREGSRRLIDGSKLQGANNV